jgi:hypothetical protein
VLQGLAREERAVQVVRSPRTSSLPVTTTTARGRNVVNVPALGAGKAGTSAP